MISYIPTADAVAILLAKLCFLDCSALTGLVIPPPPTILTYDAGNQPICRFLPLT